MAAANKCSICCICSCGIDTGENLRRRRRLDKCSQDLKTYMETIGLQLKYDDNQRYACRSCYTDIEKGAKTAAAPQSINTDLSKRMRSSVGVAAEPVVGNLLEGSSGMPVSGEGEQHSLQTDNRDETIDSIAEGIIILFFTAYLTLMACRSATAAA